MPLVPRRTHAPSAEWLSLGQASRLLGVSHATVRRWADAGRIPVFTTPGGHRRFAQRAIVSLLPAGRPRRPSISASGLTPARLARAYRRDAPGVSAAVPWLVVLSAAERAELRDLGRRLAWSLVAHLDADEPESRAHHLREATAAAARYGQHGAETGRSMGDVVEAFLAFRRPFLGEVVATARRRGFDADEVVGLYEDAERAMDRLLVATMSGHSLRRGRARGRRAAERIIE